jgi:hypothetical protein
VANVVFFSFLALVALSCFFEAVNNVFRSASLLEARIFLGQELPALLSWFFFVLKNSFDVPFIVLKVHRER